MKRNYVTFALIPGVILLVVTIIRARLEITDPDSTLTHIVSASYPTALILFLWPILMLTGGLALRQYLGVMVATGVAIRLPIAIVYTMACAQEWAVEATGEPVRYVLQSDPDGKVGTVGVFLGTFFFPTISFIVVSFVLWSLVWAIGFRNRRPYAAAPDPRPA
ncbi:MAG: hypothetical protein CMJ83_03085 [Planctomycetes bacterium]|nr:hypothetical protein [Planctomycetota bacterium]